ncbi:MAG TPA: hypothetical protein VGR73_16575 [Bryobacteraceae bacterium]|nr:hypothetical protein [Bryobacteraceae bacterium]
MVLSWIADDPRVGQIPDRVLVRVFCPLESFSYSLHTDSGSFITDIRSQMIPHWDHERIALTQFLDDALALDEPMLGYSILANIIESHPALYLDQELRDALELLANACGDEPLIAESPQTALDHCQWLQSEFESQRPFPELDRFDIRFETPLSVETDRPLQGAYNGVVQDSPEPSAICDVCCRILIGVTVLRSRAEQKQRELNSSLTAEGKAGMQLRSLFPLLDDSQRTVLARMFKSATGMSLKQSYGC